MARNRTVDPLDVEPTPQPEEETTVSTTETTTETAEAPAKEKKPKRETAPEGYAYPVEFAKIISRQILGDEKGEALRPQMVYGYLKNSKTFPVELTSDGRPMVHVEKGLQWYRDKEARKTEREAAKAAKAAGEAAEKSSDATAEG